MNESQMTPGSSIDDGGVTADGLRHRYVQDVARRFRLDAGALQVVGGYANRDGRLDDVRRIEAEARIIDGTLHRVGLDGSTRHLRLTLRPLAASGEPARLLLMLGYRDEDGDPVPFAEGFLAPSVFEALKADALSGLAQELSLAATTNLWIREEDRDRPAAQPVEWYLALAQERRESTPARGFIESVEWRRAAASSSAEAETPAPAHHAEAEEHHEDDSADQLRRINWSLKQLLLVLAFLLIIIAMK